MHRLCRRSFERGDTAARYPGLACSFGVVGCRGASGGRGGALRGVAQDGARVVIPVSGAGLANEPASRRRGAFPHAAPTSTRRGRGRASRSSSLQEHPDLGPVVLLAALLSKRAQNCPLSWEDPSWSWIPPSSTYAPSYGRYEGAYLLLAALLSALPGCSIGPCGRWRGGPAMAAYPLVSDMWRAVRRVRFPQGLLDAVWVQQAARQAPPPLPLSVGYDRFDARFVPPGGRSRVLRRERPPPALRPRVRPLQAERYGSHDLGRLRLRRCDPDPSFWSPYANQRAPATAVHVNERIKIVSKASGCSRLI